MRPKLSPEAGPRAGGSRAFPVVPGERPADPGRRPSSTCKFMLVGLARHAGPDRSGTFPSVRTLSRAARGGTAAPCDPLINAAHSAVHGNRAVVGPLI